MHLCTGLAYIDRHLQTRSNPRMELFRDGDYRHTLHVERSGGALTAYVLRIFQPGDELPPRLSLRYNLNERFVSDREAAQAGLRAVQLISLGELTPVSETLKEKFREYRIHASAGFRTDQAGWEPILKIESLRTVNKGQIQEFSSGQSAFRLNPHNESSGAAKAALDYGRRMILGSIGGLRI